MKGSVWVGMLGNEVESDGAESHGDSHGGFVAVRRRSVRKRHWCAKSNPGPNKNKQTKTAHRFTLALRKSMIRKYK